jgi:hypothetical protein|nr:MAG TPA: restriction enzyme [Caudoviricetes sp.]
MPRRINIVGEQYGELVVTKMLYGYNGGKHTYCECINENGVVVVVRLDALRNGSTKTASGSLNKGKEKDLAGKQFGKLIVKYKLDKRASNGCIMWYCECECGGNIKCSSGDLIRGRVSSCGCLVKQYYDSIAYNLTNQRFGMLVAKEYVKRKGSPCNYKRLWRCECDCGNEVLASVSDLVGGCTISCGCQSSSSGEILVETILKKYNIKFEREFTWDDCRNILPLPFDFYLPDYHMVIEYQGKQHFEPIDFFGGEEAYENRVYRDKIKKEYCHSKNIGILYIPYTSRPNEVENIILNVLSPVTITA